MSERHEAFTGTGDDGFQYRRTRFQDRKGEVSSRWMMQYTISCPVFSICLYVCLSAGFLLHPYLVHLGLLIFSYYYVVICTSHVTSSSEPLQRVCPIALDPWLHVRPSCRFVYLITCVCLFLQMSVCLFIQNLLSSFYPASP